MAGTSTQHSISSSMVRHFLVYLYRPHANPISTLLTMNHDAYGAIRQSIAWCIGIDWSGRRAVRQLRRQTETALANLSACRLNDDDGSPSTSTPAARYVAADDIISTLLYQQIVGRRHDEFHVRLIYYIEIFGGETTLHQTQSRAVKQ